MQLNSLQFAYYKHYWSYLKFSNIDANQKFSFPRKYFARPSARSNRTRYKRKPVYLHKNTSSAVMCRPTFNPVTLGAEKKLISIRYEIYCD